MSLCTAGECLNPAAKGGLCWGHLKRRQEGRELGQLRRGQGTAAGLRLHPCVRLRLAALAYADADSTDDIAFQRAWHRLYCAAQAVARHAWRASDSPHPPKR